MDRRNYAKPIKLVYECKSGREIPLDLPTRKAVCPTCEGRGSYVNPAIDEHGISPQEFAEDPDFEEAYFEGRYDVQCGECNGQNVVDVIDEERVVTSSQKRRLRLFEAQQAAREEMDREDRVTAYWESGGMYGERE